MADQNQVPWAPENVPGYQQGLSLPLDFSFNPTPGEDTGFLDGLMYNPLAAQNGQGHVLGPDGYARLGSEDFKPQHDMNSGRAAGQSSWARGPRMPLEGLGHEFPGNLALLHQQQGQPLNRPEPAQTGGTGFGPVESGARSHEDEVTAARKDMKSNREKLLRTRLNEHFSELASVLDPGRPPKNDKASILSDGVNVVKKLRDEIAKLQTEHNLLMDESKELTAEKMELREERMQVKAEKEALERRLQSMLSWINFNPSLMMAAMANTGPGQAPQAEAPAAPQSGGPAQQSDASPQENPQNSASALEGNVQSGAAQEGGKGEARQTVEGAQNMQKMSGGSVQAVLQGAAPPQSSGVAEGPVREGSPARGFVRQQGGRGAEAERNQAERGVARETATPVAEGPPSVQQQSSLRGVPDLQGSLRGASEQLQGWIDQRLLGQQPTRPQAVYQALPPLHFGAQPPHPGDQVAAALRSVQSTQDRAPRTPPEQARQPSNPPAERPAALRQQQEITRIQPRQSGPPPQNPTSLQAAAPPQAGKGRPGKEAPRKPKGQPQGKQQTEGPRLGMAQRSGDRSAASGGQVAPSGKPTSAAPDAKSALRMGQVTASGRSEALAAQPQPAEQAPPLQQPHPFPPGFPHIPYMAGFPGMIGMHPYSFPPQMTPVPSSATPSDSNQQPPPAHFPYHGYNYGQPGNPPAYPYPMFPHAHPMAYPPFGYAHPYGAPGMGAFALPPGAQPPQVTAPRPAIVQRPSAKVAQVQILPAGVSPEGEAGDGNSEAQEATHERGEEASDERAEEERDTPPDGRAKEDERRRSPEGEDPSESQPAKRARVQDSEETGPSESSRALQDGSNAQQPTESLNVDNATEGTQRAGSSSQGAADGGDNAAAGMQSSPSLAGTVTSQPSNCSSPSSGSRCGELWTQTFQSALGLPEHDPTIRPPAA